jgi:hypothetical protein
VLLLRTRIQYMESLSFSTVLCQLVYGRGAVHLQNNEHKFGTTYHTTTPSQWGTQQLAFYPSLITHVQHLSTSITTLVTRNQCHATGRISPTLLSSRLPYIHVSPHFRTSEFYAAELLYPFLTILLNSVSSSIT